MGSATSNKCLITLNQKSITYDQKSITYDQNCISCNQKCYLRKQCEYCYFVEYKTPNNNCLLFYVFKLECENINYSLKNNFYQYEKLEEIILKYKEYEDYLNSRYDLFDLIVPGCPRRRTFLYYHYFPSFTRNLKYIIYNVPETSSLIRVLTLHYEKLTDVDIQVITYYNDYFFNIRCIIYQNAKPFIIKPCKLFD